LGAAFAAWGIRVSCDDAKEVRMANPQPKDEGGFLPKDKEGHSVGEVLGEIGTSAKNFIQSEINLARTEIKETASQLERRLTKAAAFGALMVASVLPFMAFLVIGLGRVFNNNYWLSALVVALCCAVIGGMMTSRAFREVKQQDLSLPHTRDTFQEGVSRVTHKTEELKDSSSGSVHDIRDKTQRRMP